MATTDRRTIAVLGAADPEDVVLPVFDRAVCGAAWGIAYWVLTRKQR